MIETINEFIKTLKEPIVSSSIDEIQKHFDEIAKYMMNNLALVVGEKESHENVHYNFAEIEFYCCNNNLIDNPLFSCTYPREANAGDLFWHYSGLDICFASTKDEKIEFYGGILIRSLLKDGKDLVAGPLRCVNELMNQCVKVGHNMLPHLEERKIGTIDIISTIRQGIKADKDKYEEKIDEIVKNDSIPIDFPCFCYYIKRDKDKWKVDVDGKMVNYSAKPIYEGKEGRKGIARNVQKSNL